MIGFLLYLALQANDIRFAIREIARVIIILFLMVTIFLSLGVGITSSNSFSESIQTSWSNLLFWFIKHFLFLFIFAIVLITISFLLPSTKNCFIIFGITSFIKKEHLEKTNKLTSAALDMLIEKIKRKDSDY